MSVHRGIKRLAIVAWALSAAVAFTIGYAVTEWRPAAVTTGLVVAAIWTLVYWVGAAVIRWVCLGFSDGQGEPPT